MRTLVWLGLCAVWVNAAEPAVLPAVRGPLHVAGHLLLDRLGAAITLRGTAAPADLPLAYAGTMFSTIRQRFNMNAVRLPIAAAADLGGVAEFVRRANQLELAVILALDEDDQPTARSVDFWKRTAAYFRDYPNVVFDVMSEPDAAWVPGHVAGVRRNADWDFWLKGGMSSTGTRAVGMQDLVEAVRSTGARQVILAMLFDDDLLGEGFGDAWLLKDSNVVYEVCPNHRAHATDAARDRAFGRLAARVPVLAMNWDPELDQDSPDCHALPRDPAAVAELMRSLMDYFDAHQISWSASSFAPGKLIHGLDAMEPTEITLPPACGPQGTHKNGAGLDVQLQRWGMTRANFITVGAGAGSIEIPQGGIAIGYAAITPNPEVAAEGPLPTVLGGVRVRITDAAGVERWAPLFYAGIGSVNFLIDATTAPGRAQLELVRADGGASMAGSVIVSRVAPGFFTATMNARGPVVGETQGGRPLWECDSISVCRTLPVRSSERIRLFGTGFRQAAEVRATLGGVPVRVVSFGPQPEYGYNDELVLELGDAVRGLGEQDLIVFADDRVSNVVRVAVN